MDQEFNGEASNYQESMGSEERALELAAGIKVFQLVYRDLRIHRSDELAHKIGEVAETYIAELKELGRMDLLNPASAPVDGVRSINLGK